MDDRLAALFTAATGPEAQRFGPIPFWFWNDDLQAEELLRQLRAFHAAGCAGVVPHARVGLSRRVGYLTDTFLDLVRRVVDEARRLGMVIVLYDEASYPSGSARGAVAAENPDWVSQAIGLWQHEVRGPARGFWRPNTGRALRDRHVVTVAAAARGEGVDAADLRLLEPSPRGVVAYDLPAGDWRLLSVWNTDSGGHIRGAFEHEESGSATAPAAGDILNPEAVAAFVRLTHERYRQAVGDHFGRTVVALFTDEPGVFGKSPRRPAQPRPYTDGFVDWLAARWGEDPRPWLPALWLDYGDGTEAFRERYRQAVEARLHEVFYAAQRRWCDRHGLALTGHPAASNDMASLAAFHLPGQDMVWRYVEPGAATALEGAHSVAPKAAASGARRRGARRSLTELCGAYGWRLSLDEVKWLFDWHLVRGNNLLNPHAFFYSIRGRRAWESEPDLGLHNCWWPHIAPLLRYGGRLSALLADAEPVCPIAVLGDPTDLPWGAAADLLRTQRDFCYVAPADLAGGRPCPSREGPRWRVGGAAYRAVVVDMDDVDEALLAPLEAAGVVVVRPPRQAGWLDLLADVPATVRLDPADADLRAQHVRRAGMDLFLLVNEGEAPIAGRLCLPAAGAVDLWDLLRGTRAPAPARVDGDRVVLDLILPRRESRVVVVDPTGAPDPGAPAPAAAGAAIDLNDAGWTVHDADGTPCAGLGLQDWSRTAGRELFSGTLLYRADVDLPAGEGELDLGVVGDIAELRVDGEAAGLSLWAPHVVPLDGGRRRLEVRVTNSMANEYEGAQRPSGLLGPVRWRPRSPVPTPPRKDPA